MSNWYEVFDNEAVQWYARKQATYLTVVAATAVVATVVLAVLGLEGLWPLPLVGGLLVAIWLGTVRWIAQRQRKLRRIVWCVKLSATRVVGYDYTRRKTVLDWPAVARVELTTDGLLLLGQQGCTFDIPHLFPDFAALSHRVVYYAEAYDIPVYINGHPWESLDVYRLFPFLAEDPPATA